MRKKRKAIGVKIGKGRMARSVAESGSVGSGAKEKSSR